MSSRDNPFDTPRPRGVRLAQGALRVMVALQCAGWVAARLVQGRKSPVADLLVLAERLPTGQIATFETGVALGLAICGGLCLIRPSWLVLLPIIVHQAAASAGQFLAHSGPGELLVVLSSLTQLAAPMALLAIDFWPPAVKATLMLCLSAMGLLRLATVLSFLARGWLLISEAQGKRPVSELGALAERIALHLQHSADSARTGLLLLAIIEIAGAYALLASRSRLTALWLSGLGFLLAFARIIALGPTGWPDALIEISLGGAPLVVLIFWTACLREQKPVFLPELEASR